MKFNFRKIASTAASTALIGSTVALAAAASYPAPFASGGVADVGIVYGSNAASSDLVAATDVRINLENALRAQGAGSSGTPTGGDFVLLERSSTKFHLGKGIADVVSTTLTDDDLELLLADGVYLDDDNDRNDYTQKIVLGNHSFVMFDDNDYAEDQPSLGMQLSSGVNVFNYTLDFSDEPLWADLPQTNIEIMGKDYFILSVTTNQTLNLLDSAVTRLVNEGETVTVQVNDVNYEVSISFIDTDEVRFLVNGEVTNSLNEGETYKLDSGIYIGVKDIGYQGITSGISQAEFSLGSGKIELTSGNDVKMNEVTVNNLEVNITSSLEKIQELRIQWNADDEMFVAEDSEAMIPGFENLKLTYGGMHYPAEETIEVDTSSDYVTLKAFPLKDSVEDINILYGASGLYSGIGKDADNLLRTTNETSLTFDGDTDDYFVATYDDGTNAESYLVRATSFITDNSVNKTTVQYKKDGVWTDKKAEAIATDTVTFGDVTLTLGTINKDLKTVVFTSGSNVYFNRLYSEEGLKVWLPWAIEEPNANLAQYGPGAVNFTSNVSGHNATAFHLAFFEEDENENKGSGKNLNLSLQWSGSPSEPTVGDVVGETATFAEIGETDVERSFLYSPLGTELLWDKSDTNQYNFKAIYHGDESYGEFFVAETGISSGNGGVDLGSIVVYDSEITQVSAKNLVVVGGSCINSVASTLLGGAGCGSSFESATSVGAGEFLIQTFANPFSGAKVATLVAGYNAADTTNAASYLTNNAVDTTVGKKYVGTDADTAQLV